MKHCPECNQDLPKTAFGKNRAQADGLCGYCRECRSKIRRAQYAASPELREYNARVYREHAKDPEFVASNRQRARDYCREKRSDPEWCAAERERLAWKNMTPEQKQRKVERNKTRRQADPERFNRKQNEYRNKRRREDAKVRQAHRDEVKMRKHMKRANGGSYTLEEWRTMCLLVGGRCVKCGQIADLTVDHIIPVSVGGSNDISNLQPLCMSCNSIKGTEIFDYRPLTLIGSMTLEQRGLTNG